MARDDAPTDAKSRRRPDAAPPSRTRRALMALSPAALGAAGFFISGLRRSQPSASAAADLAPDKRTEETTEHQKAYYNRARF